MKDKPESALSAHGASSCVNHESTEDERDDSGFPRSKKFSMVDTACHRRHPPLVGTPSVVKHIGFWKPEPGPGDSKRTLKKDLWKADVDAFLMKLFSDLVAHWQGEREEAEKALGSANLSHEHRSYYESRNDEDKHKALKPVLYNSSAGKLKFFSFEVEETDAGKTGCKLRPLLDNRRRRYETCTMRFYLDQIPIKIRAALYDEYFTLTFAIQMCYRETEPIAGSLPENSFSGAIEKYMKLMERYVKVRWRELYPVSAKGDDQTPILDNKLFVHPAADFFYRRIWTEFFDRLFFFPLLGKEEDTNNADDESKFCLEYEVDKESIKNLDELGKPLSDGFYRVTLNLKRDFRERLGELFCDLRSCVFSVGVTSDHESIPESRVDADTAKLRDIGETISISKLFSNPERKAMLDYLSGARFSKDDSVRVTDLFYPFLESASSTIDELKGQKRDQSASRRSSHKYEYTASSILGRRGIHISSLAGDAKMDEPKHSKFLLVFRNRHRWQIGRAVERMNTLGTLRRASVIEMDQMAEVSENLRGLKLWSSMHDIQHVEQDYREKFREYQNVFVPSKDGAPGDKEYESEFLYRLERSNYYVRTFGKFVKDLRLARIEGFQKYDEFVNRRLGGNWEFIESLKTRIERVRSRLDLLANASLVHQVSEQTTKVAEQTEAVKKRTSRTTNLLRLAEVAAHVAVAYYGGYAFKEIAYGLGAVLSVVGIRPIEAPSSLLFMIGSALSVFSYYWLTQTERGRNRVNQLFSKEIDE